MARQDHGNAQVYTLFRFVVLAESSLMRSPDWNRQVTEKVSALNQQHLVGWPLPLDDSTLQLSMDRFLVGRRYISVSHNITARSLIRDTQDR
jgi:hypothetical protein